MNRILVLLIVLLALSPIAASGEITGDGVILLHGLGRTSSSMKTLESRLREAGLVVHNIDYSSTEAAPTQLLASVSASIAECCAASPAPIHFVTHSLGGILARAYIAQNRPENLGRVVLIAPPNNGSEIVDSLGDTTLFAKILGPTGQDLGTDPESFPNRLPRPDYEIGVIAGSRSINPIGSLLIPGPDDGTVSIESAKLDGAADFLVVDSSHTFIMHDSEVARQTLHFLESGTFAPPRE